jgi:RND family efflux transporter MFP subunit
MSVDYNQRIESTESTPRGRSGGGVRVALLSLGVAVLVVGGVLTVRVKQAVAKKADVAKERDQVQASAQAKEPLEVVIPVATKYHPRVDFTGTLKPWKDAELGFETQGRLTSIKVAVGDQVKAGSVIAVLDASRAGAQVSQAESQIRAAQANLAIAEDNQRRTEQLVDSKSIPEAQREQSRQQVALAKAQLEGAQASAQLARTGQGQHSILAPFAGIVTRAPTGIGAVVNPGVALVRVEDTSRFRLSATLGEEDVGLASIGTAVKIEYRDRTANGKVIAAIPSLDQATRRAPIEVEVPSEPGLLAWSFVRASIESQREATGFKLPPKAHRPGSQDEVVIVREGVAKIVKVVHHDLEDGSWMVRSGLGASDHVLVSPPPELADGEAVNVKASSLEPAPNGERKVP